MRTRLRVRMAGDGVTLRDVISEYVMKGTRMPDLVSMNRIPMMFLSHPKYGVKLLPYFRKDVCYVDIVSLSPIPRVS